MNNSASHSPEILLEFVNWFLAEIDHESERKKSAKGQEEAKLSSGSTGSTAASSSSTAPENQSSPSVRELMRQREDTPSRKRLREQVQKTVGTKETRFNASQYVIVTISFNHLAWHKIISSETKITIVTLPVVKSPDNVKLITIVTLLTFPLSV